MAFYIATKIYFNNTIHIKKEETLLVHQYKLNGQNIVIDSNSGAIHSVDCLAYDMISIFKELDRKQVVNQIKERYKQEDIEEINACYEDIIALEESGQLFTNDTFYGLSQANPDKNDVIKALCLHVAHTCNLNCSYCFAAQGKYSGGEVLMPYNVGKQALDFLVNNSGNRVNLEVDFFGGEPLMNWQVVKDLVAYGRSLEKINNKKFRFTLTTNGVLIDEEVIEFSNKEMSNVVLSLDGRKEVHDTFRVNSAGNGSYDKIVPKFKKFVESRNGKNYYIRGTFTHNNLDFTNDILHIANLGFDEISMEPVVCPQDDPVALKESDLPIIFEQYEKLAKEMIKREKEGNSFDFYHYTLDLTHGPCIHKRVLGCGVGTEYMAVTPSGELFPCHQFVGYKELTLGNIWEGVKYNNIQDKFRNSNLYTKKECENCWANFYCSGGCPANGYMATDDINGVYEYGCKIFKKRMECAIMIKVVKEMEE